MPFCFKHQVALIVAGVLAGFSFANKASAALVVNEIYISQSPTSQSFIELYNNSTSASALLSATTVTFAKTGSTPDPTNAAESFTLNSVTLAPLQYYLIAIGPTASQADFPTPDQTASLVLDPTGGELELFAPGNRRTYDVVGYGTSTLYAGTGPAPDPTSTMSISRIGGSNSGNNAADFVLTSPTPTNMSGVTVPEPASLGLILGGAAFLVGRRR